jgi:hypothetical protein
MKWFMSGTAALLLLLAAEGRAPADLIINGGFETGDFRGWIVDPNPSFPQYIVTDPVHSGRYAAQIAGFSFAPDTLSQVVATTPGQQYLLSFWRFQDDGDPTILLEVSWNGTLVFDEFNPGARPYEQFTAVVTGTGSDTLLFKSANDPAFTYLDDVSLEPIPEPASLVLLGSGGLCLALAAIRYRRLQKAAV